ncbi:bisphosphate nucleotidase [Tieghemostelium lacteum]|uniref:3'(2'),5'-bisphosphate nucleotidase 1 n=1 Tax=Tieghemostelium lacteum TaxID=361077 RepID=A0A152AAA5_TIELA|nr:bisphosphate nucleotidase [Tieghemostelium lacteum]|eukprot:KYR03061.1 bisphosphate nucleotidase [Tieghemostelium lacteum]
MTGYNLLEIVSSCIDLAEQSGKIIRDIFNSGTLDIKMKGEDDPMTVADLKSQQHIIAGLRNHWPDIKIVGEEDCEVPPTQTFPDRTKLQKYSDSAPKDYLNMNKEDVIVFIDPLDATKEFTLGRVHCVMTLIGITYKGVPVGGVIYQPFVDADGLPVPKEQASQWVGRLVWGIVGIPVENLKDKRAPEDKGKVIIVTTASHFNQDIENSIQKIQPDKVLRTGGAGYKTLMVIENLADVYLFSTVGTKLWDIAAPHAILSAVGGTLTQPSGKPVNYTDNLSLVENKNGIVVTIGDHQKYINLLNK